MPGPSQGTKVRDPPAGPQVYTRRSEVTLVLTSSPATHQLCPLGKALTSLNPSVSIHEMGMTGVG